MKTVAVRVDAREEPMIDKARSWTSEDDAELTNDAGRSRSKSQLVQIVTTAVKAAVSFGLIWYLFTRYGPRLDRFASVNLGWCFLALIAILATVPPSAERWTIIL